MDMKNLYDEINVVLAVLLENLKDYIDMDKDLKIFITKYIIYLDKLKLKLVWASQEEDKIKNKLEHVKKQISSLPIKKTDYNINDFYIYWKHQLQSRLHYLSTADLNMEDLINGLVQLLILSKRNTPIALNSLGIEYETPSEIPKINPTKEEFKPT